ncbi:hypothetical protein [Solilutibacter oculi]|uniref:hypothetical protein n=1 Tax=Solilutibacter oculi TaxID=2698682 RepID=UPI0013A63C31|nr:hypothetical protein [Lysobacter oculi]
MPSYTHFSSTPSLTELLDLGERLWHEQAEKRSMPSFNLKRLWTVAEGYMDWEKEARDFEQTRNILAQLEPNDLKSVQIFSNEQIEQLETLSQSEHEASALRLYPELRSFLSTQKQLVERSRMNDGDDVPPPLSSAAIWSPIPNDKEIGREEAFYRRTDHRLPA